MKLPMRMTLFIVLLVVMALEWVARPEATDAYDWISAFGSPEVLARE